jgi:hypothetical protein
VKRIPGSVHFESRLGGRQSSGFIEMFLKRFFREFVRDSLYHFDRVGEFPFFYGEKQLPSPIVRAAYGSGSQLVFSEQPLRRGLGGGKSPGWTDYWILHGNFECFLEIKQHWRYEGANIPTGEEDDAWAEVINQMRDVSGKKARELSLGGSRIFRVAMIFMPTYLSSEYDSTYSKSEIKKDLEQQLSSFSRKIHANHLYNIMDALRPPKPNWGASWYLTEELRDPFEWSDTNIAINPILIAACRIERLGQDSNRWYPA